jgi:hypothetical protein
MINSGSRERSRVAALERTANRAEASARLQTPLEKFCSEEAIMELTASSGVESIVAIDVSVAGFITWIRSPAVGWYAPSIQLDW